NPLYGIQRAGAGGSIVTLCGTQNTESGGDSLSPMGVINPEFRPTKITRPSHVTGLVITGQLLALLDHDDAAAVLESMYRISEQKIGRVKTGLADVTDPLKAPLSREAVIRDLIRCGYLKAADVADRFGNPQQLNPAADPDIVGPNGIFSEAEF